MSYDVTVGNADFDYTSNMRGFFRDFGVHPSTWDGRPASEVAEQISAGLQDIIVQNQIDLGKRYDSPNGWGSVPTAIRFLLQVKDACLQAPDQQVEVT